jgi:sodium-dependent dicarboxylate transporter 2/3/5
LVSLAAGPLLFVYILLLSPVFVVEGDLPLSVWWITEAILIYITALLPLIIFPYFNIVFLFLGGFILQSIRSHSKAR